MRVVVDRDVCEGNGVCEVLAPEVFELDADEVLHIAQPGEDGELRSRVVRAVANCPRNALRTLA
ncbi:ferredoxin [Kutzneria viridogrisea]|uniref:Ferredoxin n=2 Tax=Kutzneria TaxID=43356 RepID=W5W7A1_9PSEU|nr:ferredoxin [Kutzneria albida]AHH96782.1 hypothetical protein KALB_3415 [Kutzneria albida DSM 43870]MBA8927999.1 ferredoxin [Kutzneria viridogrisea]